jgi:hypothetical protein
MRGMSALDIAAGPQLLRVVAPSRGTWVLDSAVGPLADAASWGTVDPQLLRAVASLWCRLVLDIAVDPLLLRAVAPSEGIWLDIAKGGACFLGGSSF